MRKEPLIVAIIPAYNEEANIARVIMQAQPYANKVIVCDDGSDDMTAEIAEALGATVVKHKRNLGYGAALSTLFKEARRLNPDAMVTLDADGQHDPKYIPKLVKPILNNEADLVIGSRFLSEESKEKLPAYREIGIGMITKLTKRISYRQITDAQSGFRAYSNRAVQAIQPTEQGMGASTEILIKAKRANLSVKEMPIVISYDGNSSKENPVTHWTGVVLTTFKLVSLTRPLIFLGMPTLATLIVALGLWIWAARIFIATGQVFTDVTITAMGATIISMILLTTAIVLSMVSNASREKSNSKGLKH